MNVNYTSGAHTHIVLEPSSIMFHDLREQSLTHVRSKTCGIRTLYNCTSTTLVRIQQ